MQNILITGGAGFIGSNLALKLIQKGYSVRVLDNLSPHIHGINPTHTSPLYRSIQGKVDFINGCVTKTADWLAAIEGQDAIIHLAAETGTGQSMYEIQRYSIVNIGGTATLMDILSNRKHTITKILMASSRAIYGEGKYQCKEHGIVYPNTREEEAMTNGDYDCKCPVCNKKVELLLTTEDSFIHPPSLYGITKQTQEQMVLTIGKALRIPCVAFRYQNVYGPGQSLSNPYTGILSIFSTLILKNKTINIFEDGFESRDFVYIDDVINATVLGLEKDEANYKAFNVGTGISTNVKYVAERLIKEYRSQCQYIVSGNFRLGDIRHNAANIDFINKKLDYVPLVTFDTGIRKFTNWVSQQLIPESNYNFSLEEMKAKGLFK